MISGIIEAVAISNVDIHTRALIATYTASGEQTVALQLRLSGLNAAAASITVEVTHTTSAPVVLADQADVFTCAKPTAANTYWAPSRQLGPVTLKDGEILNVYATSTNASDTTVDGEMLVLDCNPASAFFGALAAVDGSEASLWGILKKILDDNGGATFDATTDSLNKGLRAGAKMDLVDAPNDTALGAVVAKMLADDNFKRAFALLIGNCFMDEGETYSEFFALSDTARSTLIHKFVFGLSGSDSIRTVHGG